MLSLSADITESDVDLKIVNGGDKVRSGDIQYAEQLSDFADAFTLRDAAALAGAREALLHAAGPQVLVDTAGVAANFQRMVRIADATGIPLDEANAVLSYGIAKELDLNRFDSAKNTPSGGLRRKLLSVIARPIARRKIKKLSLDQ